MRRTFSRAPFPPCRLPFTARNAMPKGDRAREPWSPLPDGADVGRGSCSASLCLISELRAPRFPPLTGCSDGLVACAAGGAADDRHAFPNCASDRDRQTAAGDGDAWALFDGGGLGRLINASISSGVARAGRKPPPRWRFACPSRNSPQKGQARRQYLSSILALSGRIGRGQPGQRFQSLGHAGLLPRVPYPMLEWLR